MGNRIKITFLGDIMCYNAETAALKRLYGFPKYSECFSRAKGLIADSDYVLGNLETPIAGKALKYTAKNSTVFNTPKEFAAAVKEFGVDFVSIANNHCLDKGIGGLDNTIRALDEIGLAHDGAYLSERDSEKIFVKEIGGVKIAALCFTYGTNSEFYGPVLPQADSWKISLLRRQRKSRKPSAARRFLSFILPQALKNIIKKNTGMRVNPRSYTPDCVPARDIPDSEDLKLLERASSKIARARGMADIVVVIPHIGGQNNPAAGAYQRRITKFLCDAGADIVIGGHSHTPLSCFISEDGKLVAHSLGNFLCRPTPPNIVPGILSEYGIVLNAYIENGKVSGADYSVTVSRIREDGVTEVVPLDELISGEKNLENLEILQIEKECVESRMKIPAKKMEA